ncbi:MAG: hypothetical protein A3H44_06025 [Gammaproteobacteria bacterium RIFCSPLOWO2_02_FULL_57_10]|nr:MAG: hypothetical protein A3H44_06025 [Gammaproteobacteria bacterium RIFCSPLOWO2_02_FULL_57_10]
MIVIDTHVLIWWLSNPAELSPKARKAITAAAKSNTVLVSAISALEITTLVRHGRLTLAVPVATWLADVRQLPEVRFTPVTVDIAQMAGEFGDEVPGDPADRVISATAMLLMAPLVTADAKLRAYKALETIW